MAAAAPAPASRPVKDLYELGEVPPLGHVPANMYAWAIRKDRHGPPEQSFKVEVVPTSPADTQKPEFREKLPLGKVPAFEGPDGFLLTESRAIFAYGTLNDAV